MGEEETGDLVDKCCGNATFLNPSGERKQPQWESELCGKPGESWCCTV